MTHDAAQSQILQIFFAVEILLLVIHRAEKTLPPWIHRWALVVFGVLPVGVQIIRLTFF